MQPIRLKILAIDDLPDNLTTLGAVVRETLPDSTLLTALDGPQGIELARAEDPDVILLDIVMPVMDGFEVCRRLKADERMSSIPVIFLTALRTERKIRVMAMEAGAEAFLSKPIDDQELMAQVLVLAKLKAANRLKRMEKEQLAALVAERTRELEHELAERKRAEAYGKMGQEILQILNEPDELEVSIQHVLAALKTQTGFDAVGIRLQDGEDFPYFCQQGFSSNFLLKENSLLERSEDGAICRNKDGAAYLECTCGLVLSGLAAQASQNFTAGGSFWTSHSFSLLDMPPGEDPRHHPRNECIRQGYASVALIPIRAQKRIVGLIQLNDRRKGRFTIGTVELLEGIASHIGAALMRKRLESEILAISDREQQRIGHDLHDGLGQQLTALEMKCFLLLEDLKGKGFEQKQKPLQGQAQEISLALRECVTVTRSLAHGLAAVNLEAGGLACALDHLAHRIRMPGKIASRFFCRSPITFPNPQTAGHLYRIAQEAVNNALKHAQTQRIHIHLAHGQGMLRLKIKDYGQGLPMDKAPQSGMGLEVMRHRAQIIGASLEIHSKPGQGVTVTCSLPLGNHDQ